MILSFEEAGDLLDEMAEEFPPEFYDELNGGISLLPEAREDPAGAPGELYILGEYCNDMMGRYINLYYGSFAALAQLEDWTEEDWEDELYTTLAHEFTHHIEGRAGERGLEIKDEQFMEKFRAEHGDGAGRSRGRTEDGGPRGAPHLRRRLQRQNERRDGQMSGENGTAQKGRLGFLRYIPFKAVIAVVIVLAIAGAGIGMRSVVLSENRITKLGFEDIGELATQAAYCTQVNVTEGSRELFGLTIPFTQSRYIYSYDVVIRAGLDFGAITWTVQDHTITVHLPETRVLSSEIDLDSFQVYLESESIFRRISLEENNDALKALQESAEENAIANGLLDNARSNAETILTGFFASAYDLEDYELRFVDQ